MTDSANDLILHGSWNSRASLVDLPAPASRSGCEGSCCRSEPLIGAVTDAPSSLKDADAGIFLSIPFANFSASKRSVDVHVHLVHRSAHPAASPSRSSAARSPSAISPIPTRANTLSSFSIEAIVAALRETWGSEVRQHRASPVVSTRDNYDRLGYAPDAITRDARYTRYVCDVAVLRTQTSAMIPALLSKLTGLADGQEVLLVCPGLTLPP